MPGVGNPGGGSGGSGAIRAGRAFVELFLNDNAVYRSLAKLKDRFAALGSGLLRAGGAAIGAGTALLAPLIAPFNEAIDRAAQIGDLASIFGGTTETVSRMAFAFETAGLTLDDLESSMSRLAKIDDSGRPLDEVFAEVVTLLNEMPAGLERSKFAADIFGKSYSKILDVAQDLTRLMDEAPIISTEDTARAEEFNQEIAKTKAILRAATLPMLEAITPTVKALTDFVRRNAGAVTVIAAVGAGMVAAGLAAAGLGLAILSVTAIIGGAVLAFGALTAAIAALVSSPGLILAGLGTLAFAITASTENGARGFVAMADGVMEFGETAKSVFDGIGDAVRAGEWGLAFEIALTGMSLEWAKAVSFWTEGWNKFKSIFVDGWHNLVAFVAVAGTRIKAGLEIAFESVGTFVGNILRRMADEVLGVVISIAEVLKELDPSDTIQNAINKANELRGKVDAGARERAFNAMRAENAAIVKRQVELEEQLALAEAAAQKARDAARAADLAAAKGDIARLQGELAALRARAAAAREAAAGGGFDGAGLLAGGIAGALAGIPRPGQLAALAGQARGVANVTNARGQFAFGDKIKKPIDETAKNTKDTVKELKKLHEGLRFKK